jgi:hypothetical protein
MDDFGKMMVFPVSARNRQGNNEKPDLMKGFKIQL